MDLTIFEVHLDEPTFTANAPFAGDESSEPPETHDAAPSDETAEGRSMMPALVGLVFLVGVALAARRFLRDEEPPTDVTTTAEADAETVAP